MKSALVTFLMFASFVTSIQAEPERREDTLEGVLRVHPKYLYRYYIDGFGGGQSCALRGLEKMAKRFEPGSRIKVTGTLGVDRHEGGTETNPSPFPATTYIFMDVREINEIAHPTGEADIALALARRIAAGIEGLKPKYPHLSDFSAETHVRQNVDREGYPAGSPSNPELATIAYFHGVSGERPKAPIAKGEPKKRSADTIFDPETGVRLYVHVFKGDSRGADARPPFKVGDLSVHLGVEGPAAEAMRADIKRVIEAEAQPR